MATFKVHYTMRDTYEIEIEAPSAKLAEKWLRMQINEGHSPHTEDHGGGAYFLYWNLGKVEAVEKVAE